jgi:hypothetical protein
MGNPPGLLERLLKFDAFRESLARAMALMMSAAGRRGEPGARTNVARQHTAGNRD